MEPLRKRVKSMAIIHLILASMMISSAIAWALFPAITEVKYVYIHGDGHQSLMVFRGEILGWRLISPALLLLHFLYVMRATLRLIIAAEKVPSGRPNLKKILNCLNRQHNIVKLDVVYNTAFVVTALMVDVTILKEVFLGTWFSFGIWLCSRIYLIQKLDELVNKIRMERREYENVLGR